MKNLLASLLLFSACMLSAEAGALDWKTDHPAALASAAKSQRVVLLNFTGSDWCVWCHRLRDEVFLTDAFAKYAADSLVLVELDFPRGKSLPPALKKQNDALVEKYGVTGYPTILVLSPEGKLLGQLGYMQGGPKTFIREIKRLAARGSKS